VALEKIENAILGEARKEADRIREAGRKRIDDASRQAQARLERQLEQRMGEVEQRERDQKNRAMVALRAAGNMELLAAKNEVIDKVFARALEKVVNLPSNGYRTLLLGWLKNAAVEGPAELLLNARDLHAFGPQLVLEANKARPKESAFKLSTTPAEMAGGFVLRTGRYEIDRTLDGIVAKLKEEMAPEIAQTLFGARVEKAE